MSGPLPHPTRTVPRSPVAWQKRWKVPRACTCWAWLLRKGGSRVTRGRLSGPEASQGLRGEEDDSGPRQDREKDPGGGKGRGGEAARQRTEKREGTEAEVVRNTACREGKQLRKRRDPAPPCPAQAAQEGQEARPPHAFREGGPRPQQITCPY